MKDQRLDAPNRRGSVTDDVAGSGSSAADETRDRFCVAMKDGNPMLGAFVIDREGVLEKRHFADAGGAIGAAVMLNELATRERSQDGTTSDAARGSEADANKCPGKESEDGQHCIHLFTDGLCCWCDADPYGLFNTPETP